MPAQLLFISAAIVQYIGSGLAVLLFARLDAGGVAWLRVVAAAAALAAWRRPWATRWTRAQLTLVASWGTVIAAMNLGFYLAIDRIPLGTAVAIEFIGPIAVVAAGSRSRRDWTALGVASLGVILLADVHLAGEPLGVLLAFGAGVCWAAYIVLGHRVAAEDTLRPRDGLAAGMAFGALVTAPILVPFAAPAFGEPDLLGLCLAVGVLASVVPYALEQAAMVRLTRARFALLLALLPATATVVGAIVLDQIPTATEVVGILLVVIAATMGSHRR